MEVLREGYRIPFRRAPTLSREPIPFRAYCPNSIWGKALVQEVASLLRKGAIEPAPLPSPGFYSRLFVTLKASGSWRPIIDLSRLNLMMLKTPFKMETLQPTLLSVRRGDWMVSVDLRDAYLQIPVHLESWKFLQFVVCGKVYQFKTLFWSSHGSSSLHAGHGSGFGNPSPSWHSAPSLSGRLADSGVLPGAGSPVFEDSSSTLQFPGDRRQLGEVSACSDSNHLLSGSYSEYHHFPGFSHPDTDRQAALSWRRISVLRGSACKILARIARSAVLFNSAHSGRTTENAVVPVSLQPTLGSTGSRSDSSVVSGGPPGPSLVASPRASRTRNLSGTGIPSARLMVRRLGCRLGGAPRRPGRFRPLVSRRIAKLHQPSRAPGDLL